MKLQTVTDDCVVVSLDDGHKKALADFLKVGIAESQKPNKNYYFFPEVYGQAAPEMTIEKLEASIGAKDDVTFIRDEIEMFHDLSNSYKRREIDVSFLNLGEDPLSEIRQSFGTIIEQIEAFDLT